MKFDRQALWNVKETAIQAGWFPLTARPYYRNNDGSPHEHNGSYHITIDWRWEDDDGKSWQKTCHANINRETEEHEDTTLFPTREMESAV